MSALAVGLLIALLQSNKLEGAPCTVDSLPHEARISGTSLWLITAIRKSGYMHDQQEVNGSARLAIDKVLSRCRRAGIYSILITKNEAAKLEFFSSNQGGRGKSIGGFRIEATADIVLDATNNVSDFSALSQELQDSAQKIDQRLSQLIAELDKSHHAVTYTEGTSPVMQEEAVGLDDQHSDPWDVPSTFFQGPYKCEADLSFSYRDRRGVVTRRSVKVSEFFVSDVDVMVGGLCSLRHGNRYFRESGMSEIVDSRTTVTVVNLREHLQNLYQNSDQFIVDEFIRKDISYVSCLRYLASLDGNITRKQNLFISRFVKQKASGKSELSDESVKKLISKFAEELSPSGFRSLVKLLSANDPKGFKQLMDLANEVVYLRIGDKSLGVKSLEFMSKLQHESEAELKQDPPQI